MADSNSGNETGLRYGSFFWASVIVLAALFISLPQTRKLFETATRNYPYIMGFVKFAILSTMGELLAARVVFKKWVIIKGIFPKMVVWGLLGVLIVLMFSVYSKGVEGAVGEGLLYTGSGQFNKLFSALYISSLMNLTFAPVFMASHRITDVYIDSRYSGNPLSFGRVIKEIDWDRFIKFVVAKTIPFFWIPAHTITFLLPDQYKVIFAASLSILLGLILSIARMRK